MGTEPAPTNGEKKGKQSGPHVLKRLTPKKVAAITEPGRHSDGGGLYLSVSKAGTKSWVALVTIRRAKGQEKIKRREIGLGSVRLYSLIEARERARKMAQLARDGIDPTVERDRILSIPTFEEAAYLVHEENKESWSNGKHVDQWINTLKTDVFPIIGKMPVSQIRTQEIMKVLSPIWRAKPETARRIRQRVRLILDWATLHGHRSGDNPCNLVDIGLPKQRDRKRGAIRHLPAMDYQDVPAFARDLPNYRGNETTNLALEFLILCAARTGEVLGATWDEISEAGDTWIIPAERMKAGEEHSVPLSKRCQGILARVRELGTGTGYIFPGARSGKPLSNMAFTMIMRRANLDATPHGFRTSFRNWCAEKTSVQGRVAEAALAHTIKNKTERAYNRTDLFEKRRDLMARWAAFVTGEDGKVIPLRAS